MLNLDGENRSRTRIMNIAIFSGGDSSEFEISVKSANQVKKWLELAGHSCFLVEVKKGHWK